MRDAYCYLPILPARGGHFRAVDALSSLARSRLIPFFDVPAPVLERAKTVESYLTSRADGIHRCWETDRPIYVDVHNFPLDLRTESGAQPITYLVDLLRMRGLRPIPVTGIEDERGTDYLKTIRALIRGESDGVCVRVERDELNEPKLLRTSLSSTVNLLALDSARVDLVLDFRYVGRDAVEVLHATTLEALRVIREVGSFRNIAIAGGSVPDQLTRRDQGKVRREQRIELEVWSQVISMAEGELPIALGDFGVIGANYVPPADFKKSPARIRYTTARDHVFRRAKLQDYRDLCRQLVDSPDYFGPAFSLGDQRIALVAKGQERAGNAPTWIAVDTNHHLELVSAQVWDAIQQQGLRNRFSLPEPSPRPWLQHELSLEQNELGAPV